MSKHTLHLSRHLPPRKLLASAISVAIATAYSPVMAETDNAKAVELPKVSVEGKQQPGYKAGAVSSPKYTVPLRDVPQTVNIITEELFEQQGATTLRDVLRNVPGISMQAGEGGTPAGDQLSIRGFSARTDIFIDGVRDFGGYSRDPFNLEAVEVVKGPASSYTGRGSTGGSINLVSKSPGQDQFINGDATLGTDSFKRATIDVNQPLDKLGISNAAFRLNLMGHDADVPDRDIVENQRWGFAPSLTLGLGTPTEFTLSYFRLTQDNIPDYGIPWVPPANVPLAAFADKPAPVDFSNFYGLKNRDYEDVTTDVATAEITHAFNESANVRNLFRYGETVRDSIITAPRFANNNSTDITRTDWKSRDQTDTVLSNQTDLTLSFDTGFIDHTVVTGFEFAHETEENFTRVATGPDSPDTDLFNPNPGDPYLENIQRDGTKADTTAQTIAVYAFDTLELTEQWQISGGLRWEEFDVDFTSAAGDKFDRKDDLISWRTALVFKPLPNGSVYFGYGTSFNPSAEGLTLNNTPTAANSVNLSPEENKTYEFGTKWDLFSNRALFTAAIFRIEKTNARTQDPNDPNDVIVLAGEQRVDGLELGLAGNLTADWQAFAGYTYLSSELVETLDALQVGNELPNTPRHTFNLWTTYQLPKNFEVGGGVQFVDDRYNNTANLRKAPGYWLYNATAAYQVNKNLTIRLIGNNLADEEYIDFVGGGHFIPGAGRQFLLTTGFQFY